MSLATAPPPTLVEQQTELFRELNAVLSRRVDATAISR